MKVRSWWVRARRRTAPRDLTVVLRSGEDAAGDEARRLEIAGLGLACILGGADTIVVPPDVGGLLTFVEPGDEVQPQALSDLARRIAGTGAGAGLGTVARRRSGRLSGHVTPPVLGEALSTQEHAALLALVDLRGVVVSARVWRDACPDPVPWDGPAAAGTSVLLAVPEVVATSDLVVVTDEAGEVGLPVEERRRHRTDRGAASCRGVVAASAALPAGLRAVHASTMITQHLASQVTDALAGRARGLGEVSAMAQALLDHVDEDDALRWLSVEDRVRAQVTRTGVEQDIRDMAVFLEDNPRGLPSDGSAVTSVARWLDAVPSRWRTLDVADRRLRVRLLEPQVVDGRWQLDGNAFLTSDPGGLASVEVDGVALDVVGRLDPSADAWAARDHETHAACGFRGAVDLDLLPAAEGRARVVEVTLKGRQDMHSVAEPGPVPPVVLTVAALEGDVFFVSGRGRAGAVRLAGPRATTEWTATVPGADGTFTVSLPLSTPLFSTVGLLPGGQYVVEVRADLGDRPGGAGRLAVAWAADLRRPEVEWVTERVALRPRAPDRLVVGLPVRLGDDSARARHLRMNTWTSSRTAALSRTVVLESFGGRSVADNPLAVARELARRELDVDLVWLVDDPSVRVPEGSRAVSRRTPEMFDVLANAAAYVSNASAPAWWRKRPDMVHLQTWHGVPLKRLGEDRGPGDFATWRHRETVAAQAANWDALVSPSPFCTSVFRSAFRFGGRVVETGQPRNDVLTGVDSTAVRTRARAELGLDERAHVVLYAPTWRDQGGDRVTKPVYLDIPQFLESMPGTTLLVRGHYNASRQPDLRTADRMIDVTRYPDAADLLCVADALVTDFSSIMFDFCLTGRPVVLLAPDLESYRDVHPGMYFDIAADPPGPLVRDTPGVVAAMGDGEAHAEARARFAARFCPLDDGHASARVVDHLLDLLGW